MSGGVEGGKHPRKISLLLTTDYVETLSGVLITVPGFIECIQV